MNTGISRKRMWLIVGGVVLLLGVLYLAGDLGKIISLLENTNWTDIFIASIFVVFGYLLITVRLRYILFNRLGWWKTFYGNSIGFLVHITMFVPAMVSRSVCIGWVTSVSTPQAYSALVVERLLDMIMRVLVTLVYIAVFAAGQDPFGSVGGSVVMLVIAFAVLFWLLKHRETVVEHLVHWITGVKGISEEQVRDTASSMLQGLDAIGSARRLTVGLLVSCLVWASFFIFQFLVISALPVSLSINQRLTIAAAVLIVMPPSVNVMLIVYQAIVVISLLALQLTDTNTAIVYSIALYLVMLLWWAVFGGWSYTQTDLKLSQLTAAIKQYAHKDKAATDGSP